MVTPIGCGIAGYTPEEIAPMLSEAASQPNVYLPISFWKVLRNDVFKNGCSAKTQKITGWNEIC